MPITLETRQVAGIPVLTLVPDDPGPRPVVFFVPGYTGAKESGLSLGYRLARLGFYFVSFDPLLHGERYAPRLDHAHEPAEGGIYPPETGLDTGVTFFHVIHQCALDIRTLIGHLADDLRADTARCGVTGLSMGGYASYLAFADIPELRAAVPMIGIPAFTQRWLDLLDECAFSNRDWAAALRRVEAQTAAHTVFIREIDPAERLRRAVPRALLMMNCDFDTDQPKLYAVRCYRDLEPHYRACPGQLRMMIYPAAHVVTPDMERDAADWFVQHLLQGG